MTIAPGELSATYVSGPDMEGLGRLVGFGVRYIILKIDCECFQSIVACGNLGFDTRNGFLTAVLTVLYQRP